LGAVNGKMASQGSMRLGIDFGTSNSAIAVVQDSKVVVLPVEDGQMAMPTALFFDAETQKVQFGRAALTAYKQGYDGRLMRSLKSLLGSDLMDEHTEIFGKATLYQDLITFYLAELKKRAEKNLGIKITAATIGRPVQFVDDDPERDERAQNTLQAAAVNAGFKDVRFQFEPIAAALDFESQLTKEELVLVADIGGGTSDFSVIRLGPRQAKKKSRVDDLLATSGIHAAGTDFDRALSLASVMPLLGLGHVGQRGREVPRRIFFELATWHRIHLAQSAREVIAARDLDDVYADQGMHKRLMKLLTERYGHRLAADVEQAKIDGSNKSDASVTFDLNYLEADLSQTVSNAQITKTLEELLSSIVQCAQQCVAQAGVKSTDIQRLYLTGGSSALPAFQAALQGAFKGVPMVSGDLFGSVAAGLAKA
jgi:hypothetical chaperone protein